MKLRRLQEIDLANAGPANRQRKRGILKPVIEGFGPWSYDPARKATFDVFNPTDPLGLAPKKPPLEKVLHGIKQQCSKVDQVKSCTEVVELLDHWVADNVENSVEQRVPAVSLGSLGIASYSENLVGLPQRAPDILLPGSSTARRTNAQRARVCDFYDEPAGKARLPEYAEADLLILQFVQRGKSPRRIITTSVDDVDVFDVEELDKMVDETFEVWQELHEELFGIHLKTA